MGNSGFSFVGLMLLVTLLAIAGSFVFVSLTPSISTTNLKLTVERMDKVLTAIQKFKSDSATNSNPPSLNYLLSDVGSVGCSANTAASKMQGWCGPYLQSEFTANPNEPLTDGWGTSFEYDSTGVLNSWGPNRTDDGGSDDDLTRNF